MPAGWYSEPWWKPALVAGAWGLGSVLLFDAHVLRHARRRTTTPRASKGYGDGYSDGSTAWTRASDGRRRHGGGDGGGWDGGGDSWGGDGGGWGGGDFGGGDGGGLRRLATSAAATFATVEH